MVTTKLDNENINRPLVARLKAQMVRKGLNPKTLAERANVGRSFVYDILNGKSTNPTSTKITAIADELGVSMQYLLSGIHPNLSERQRQWGDVCEVSSLQVESSLGGETIVTVEQRDKPYYFRRDWIINELAARPEDIRAIFIRGDSMEPTLHSGDMILINISQHTPNPPGIFILFDGMGLVAKRLEIISPGRLRIMSDNPKYPTYESNIEDTRIVGKVIWLAREL